MSGHYRSYQVLSAIGGALDGAAPVVQALRDSLSQDRVAIDDLPALLSAKLAEPWRSPKLA